MSNAEVHQTIMPESFTHFLLLLLLLRTALGLASAAKPKYVAVEPQTATYLSLSLVVGDSNAGGSGTTGWSREGMGGFWVLLVSYG